MATTETTTIRVPVDLRDEIARLAKSRGHSMVDIVAEAVRRLRRDEWWASVHDSLDAMTPGEQAAYRSEAEQLDRSARDGL